jgi:ribosomal-protein-alanine N-acetyltransferase
VSEHNSSILIRTPRLILREYAETDFKGVHAFSQDPETVRFMTWGPNTPEDTRAFIQLAISQQAVEPRRNYHFVVALQQNDQIIGGCGIHIRRPDHQGAEIGYCYNRRFWGQGYATEATAALLRFGFMNLGLHRIIATCDPRNRGSERVMQKNGMRKEAHFIQELWNARRGEWRDSLLYAILENEWHELSI